MCKDSIDNYLDDLASKKPAPGGGSAAALVGAMGAALVSKVANFTIGKEKYKTVGEEMKGILSRSEQLRESLTRLCSEDESAYKRFSQAIKFPKGPQRERKVQEALREAIAVPVQVCKNAHEAIKLCLPLAQKGNVNLITDTGIASTMLNDAFKCALYNIEINLKSIKDEKFILEIREILEPMEKEIVSINQEVTREVEKHLTKG